MKNLKKGISLLVNYKIDETLENIQKKLKNNVEFFFNSNMFDLFDNFFYSTVIKNAWS